jgi:hypothetical protein
MGAGGMQLIDATVNALREPIQMELEPPPPDPPPTL